MTARCALSAIKQVRERDRLPKGDVGDSRALTSLGVSHRYAGCSRLASGARHCERLTVPSRSFTRHSTSAGWCAPSAVSAAAMAASSSGYATSAVVRRRTANRMHVASVACACANSAYTARRSGPRGSSSACRRTMNMSSVRVVRVASLVSDCTALRRTDSSSSFIMSIFRHPPHSC